MVKSSQTVYTSKLLHENATIPTYAGSRNAVTARKTFISKNYMCEIFYYWLGNRDPGYFSRFSQISKLKCLQYGKCVGSYGSEQWFTPYSYPSYIITERNLKRFAMGMITAVSSQDDKFDIERWHWQLTTTN